MVQEKPTNAQIAGVLERIAELLEAQDANPFRARAYQNAAQSIRTADQSIADLARQPDESALTNLPGIGEGLAGVIQEYVNRGRSSLLEELESESDPVEVFSQVPGLGKELAQRIVNELDINTLEGLERAANDGSLDQVSGFGPERVEAVRLSLAGRLSGAAQSRIRKAGSDQNAAVEERPSVALLLALDQEYRDKAAAGELHHIAPKRFNPSQEAWLPIFETRREGWAFTVLFSNTRRAHELEKTHDWVVIYYRKAEQEESQATVVTAASGKLEGKRVVRGRELETARYYRENQPEE